jgi:hypothetical protein
MAGIGLGQLAGAASRLGGPRAGRRGVTSTSTLFPLIPDDAGARHSLDPFHSSTFDKFGDDFSAKVLGPLTGFKGKNRSIGRMGLGAMAYGYSQTRGMLTGRFNAPSSAGTLAGAVDAADSGVSSRAQLGHEFAQGVGGRATSFNPMGYANRMFNETIHPRMNMPGFINKARGIFGTMALAGGTGIGMAAGGAVTLAGYVASGVGKAANFLLSNRRPILAANIAGLVGGTIMAAGLLGGGGTQPKNLGSQLTAIAEQFTYESSGAAGMGSEMFGVRANPLPSLPAFQKAKGYSPQALGAMGDLTLALSSLRRQ